MNFKVVRFSLLFQTHSIFFGSLWSFSSFSEHFDFHVEHDSEEIQILAAEIQDSFLAHNKTFVLTLRVKFIKRMLW